MIVEFYTLDSGEIPLDIIRIHKPKLIQILNLHPKGHFWPCGSVFEKTPVCFGSPCTYSSQSIGLALSLVCVKYCMTQALNLK